MEYVCNLMSGSEYSTFFDAETKENIAAKLRSDSTILAQLKDDSVDSVFQLFQRRVQQNLHVVFSTSPYTDKFHERCRVYPGLINYSTVNWFDDWPAEAFSSVAETFLFERKEREPVAFPESFLNLLVFTHSTAEEMCARFLSELGRHYHVTPKSFLDFLSLFLKICGDKNKQTKHKLERLRAGLSKLEDTNAAVLKMKDELIQLGPILEQKSKVRLEIFF